MAYIGDFTTGVTLNTKFCTVTTTGAPTTLAGTPAISVYKNNSTTQSTSGITLSVDFDSVTGLNNVNIDLSSDGTFYASGSDFQIVITTGTVGGTSVVGYVVGEFSINNRVSNVTRWNGTAVSSPATAGIPDVNVKNVNNVSASSVSTVNANLGTTQPVNFTGTAGSALVKGDTVDIAGSAVSTSSAQIGVNVVNVGGSASTGTAGYVGVDWGQVANKTTANALTATTISTSQVVGSVTGAVGSVTAGVSVGTGGIQSSSFAASAIDASAIATDAIGSAELAASAVTKIAAGVFARAFAAAYGSYTFEQLTEIMVSALAAKLSGAATTTVTIRNLNDSADVISATVDSNGNRTAVTLNP